MTRQSELTWAALKTLVGSGEHPGNHGLRRAIEPFLAQAATQIYSFMIKFRFNPPCLFLFTVVILIIFHSQWSKERLPAIPALTMAFSEVTS